MSDPFHFFVDLHCHPSMRIFHHHASQKNYWEQNANQDFNTGLSRWVQKMSPGVARVSQSSFDHCMRGRVRVVFDSLYPIERGFIRFRPLPEFFLSSRVFETIVGTVSGISSEQFYRARESDDYFAELLEQYAQLQDNQGPSPCGQYAYKIVSCFDELERWLGESANHLAVIVTIEGAHVLGCGTPSDEGLTEPALRERVLKRLKALKKWEHPPFFITMAHHFWNQLCGHSATLPGPARFFADQNKGLNTGFTALGWEVLKELLRRDNGKRILIDTRHMSVKARQEYYAYLKAHHRDNPKDPIPVISSHSAANGFKTLAESVEAADTMAKKKRARFCNWSLNISDEEMQIITELGGLVGIILDKGRHSGIKALASIDALGESEEQQQAFVKLLLDNMFALVEAVGSKDAWDVLTLGSDFDGAITHFDTYKNLTAIPQLEQDLVAYLNAHQYRKPLWFGLAPEEIVRKVLSTNAMEFLKRHFR